jgi:hypothetical protein
VLAVDADVEALEAEVDALEADVLAALALVAAALAEAAAAVAEAPAAAASTTRPHLAESALVLIGNEPLDVCAVNTMYTLALVVSLIKSRFWYDTPDAQLPRQLPIASPAIGLPLESKANVLPALAVLTGKVMLMLVGSVTGALMPRSAVSATC